MKKCPFCAEEIQDEAIKCRFCNEILDGQPRTVSQPAPIAQKTPWYCAWWLIALIYVIYPPYSPFLAIAPLWLHPRWGKKAKIAWTVFFILSACGLFAVKVNVLKPMFYNNMQDAVSDLNNLNIGNILKVPGSN